MNLVNTIGTVVDLVASGNEAGYDIGAQRFFAGMNKPPPVRSSVSEARQNISYEAFKHLLIEARIEVATRWHGHRLHIVDGTKINLPRTDELVELFGVPNTKAGSGHYPQAWMVTLLSGICHQPLDAVLGGYKDSERDLMRKLLHNLSDGDLMLLDRGLGGSSIYWECEQRNLFYLHRVKTSGDRVPFYIKEFVACRRKSQVVSIEITTEHGEKFAILVRLVRGPKDSEGKRIVFATNLLNEETYSEQSIRALYKERWSIETTYGRIKNILKLEKFHARNLNGILQEIFANLLVISLAAAVEYETSRHLALDRTTTVPNFKAAMFTVYEYLHAIVGTDNNRKANIVIEEMIQKVGRILWRKQPGRSYPRVSRQSIKKWNLCKQRKLKEFEALKS